MSEISQYIQEEILDNDIIKMRKYIKDEYLQSDKSDISDRFVITNLIAKHGLGLLSIIKDEYLQDITYIISDIIDEKGSITDIMGEIDDELPEQFKTYDFYYEMISQGFPLEEVPKQYRDYRMCSHAALCFGVSSSSKDYYYQYPIQSVPKDIIDEYLYELLIYNLTENLNIKLDTEELNYLEYLPSDIINEEVVDKALDYSIWCYTSIPDKYKSKEIIEKTISLMNKIDTKNKWYYSGFRFEMIKSTPREILEDYDLCVKLVREYLENKANDLEDIKEYIPKDILLNKKFYNDIIDLINISNIPTELFTDYDFVNKFLSDNKIKQADKEYIINNISEEIKNKLIEDNIIKEERVLSLI